MFPPPFPGALQMATHCRALPSLWASPLGRARYVALPCKPRAFSQIRNNIPQNKWFVASTSSDFWCGPPGNCSGVTKEAVVTKRSTWVLRGWDGEMALETSWGSSDTRAKLSWSCCCWHVNRNASERSVGREKAFGPHSAAYNLTKDTHWS